MTHGKRAAREHSRVALVTCAELPALDPDDQRLAAALRERGTEVTVAVWDDPAVDWHAFDLVVIRSTWDYTARRDDFVRWADRVPRLRNPASLVRWNTDKRYLLDLERAGVPVIPTEWVSPDEEWTPPGEGEYVVKPAVGAGSRDSGRYRLTDPAQREQAHAHVTRLRRQRRLVMVQPYVSAVDRAGETALLFFADPCSGALTFSHAIRKDAMLAGPVAGGQPPPRQGATITPRTPSEAERALADKVLGALPDCSAPPLYARVDLVPGPAGRPRVIEVELTEPSMFLGYGAGAATRFAASVSAVAGAGSSA